MAAAQGVMKQSKSLPDGRLLVTGFRFAGEPLPYRDAWQPWDVDIEAVTASVVCRIAVPTLARLREVHPQIDRQILAWAQREISVANEHMLLLGLKRYWQLSGRQGRNRQPNPVRAGAGRRDRH
jgi:CRP-like cAMP-binding protein